MDLETRLINKTHNPFCISIYDGKVKTSFYITSNNDYTRMLRSTIIQISKRKYNGYRVFLLNFSKFDGIFLIKNLAHLTDIMEPVIRDNRFIDLKFNYETDENKTKNVVLNYNTDQPANSHEAKKTKFKIKSKYKYKLFFRYSYLLLAGLLKDLAKGFKVDNKGIYPYLFPNEKSVPYNYIGPIPEFKYFNPKKIKDRISKDQYNEYCKQYKNNIWNLEKETIKYCEQDCITLYQIIDKFSYEIFDIFNLDIMKYPTFSSLAFAIYRSNYLKDFKIPLITGELYNDLVKGYTGGAVDVYKPYGFKIYGNDINSLYPTAMDNYPMPVGTVTYF